MPAADDGDAFARALAQGPCGPSDGAAAIARLVALLAHVPALVLCIRPAPLSLTRRAIGRALAARRR